MNESDYINVSALLGLLMVIFFSIKQVRRQNKTRDYFKKLVFETVKAEIQEKFEDERVDNIARFNQDNQNVENQFNVGEPSVLVSRLEELIESIKSGVKSSQSLKGEATCFILPETVIDSIQKIIDEAKE